MADIALLRAQMERDIFDYQQLDVCLREYRKPRDQITGPLARGHFIRIRKGLYSFAPALRRGPLSRELLANLIHGPSYISFDYALAFHGLIPERVQEISSACVGRSRVFRTPQGAFRYDWMPRRRYCLGADIGSSGGKPFLIASPEKTLADKVWSDKRFSGGSLAEYRAYVLEDLRMDPERLATLRRDRLEEVGEAYGSPKIAGLVRFVTSLQGGNHA